MRQIKKCRSDTRMFVVTLLIVICLTSVRSFQLPDATGPRVDLTNNSRMTTDCKGATRTSTKSDYDNNDTITNRRMLLQRLFATTITSTSILIQPIENVNAFANKISNKYDDRPKRRGPQPPDLGIGTRIDNNGNEYIGLKSCSYAPNCFSSSIPYSDDPDHAIPFWTYPSNENITIAFTNLYTILQQYPPGQNNIDGGGYTIKQYDPINGYIYVQYESLKNGYIDDFEAAAVSSSSNSNTISLEYQNKNAIQIRSSSRVGYLDYGVNGKRLNYIANELRKIGWYAPTIDRTTHARYFIENENEN